MLDRLEDKQVRRASRKTKLDPMVDEDSADEEDYSFPPQDATEPSHTSQAERTRQSRTSDVDEDAATPTNGRTTSFTSVPASVGSALRKNANGSATTPKVLPKRDKGSKVGETMLRVILG